MKYMLYTSPPNAAEGIERANQAAMHVLAHPPHTWQAHAEKPGGLWAVVEMEFAEAKAAHAAMKAETGTHADFVRQLSHLSAAALRAYAAMTCD